MEKKMSELMIIIMIIMSLKEMSCCVESERNALLQLKSVFNPKPQQLTSWVASDDSDCCNWERVHCNSTTGRVIILDFSSVTDNDLIYLNASLFLPFPQLTELNLEVNAIAGCIQNEGFERLSTLVNLEILNLNFNNFSNSILQSLSGLSSLKSLDLSQNKLEGTINISDLNNLTATLQELHLTENQIEGFETVQDVKFKKLEYLDLSYNRFNSNSSLSALRGMSSLKTLHLQYNRFKGLIQTGLKHMISPIGPRETRNSQQN